MKIFVGGSLRDVQVDGTLCRQFVEKFAEKIFTASILYSQGVGALWIKPSLRQHLLASS
jgi:hypothetical protein